MIPTLDLDTSILIDLDQARPGTAFARQLVRAHGQGLLKSRLIAASASERQQDGSALSTFGDFERWVERLGLAELEIRLS